MIKLSFVGESVEKLAHASLVIRATQDEQEGFITGLNVPLGDRVALDAAEAGGIKDVHDFSQHVLLSPQFGAIRLGIIYNGHELTHEAQNALLKLLEEPPERIRIVIFVSTEASILPTINSRCRRYYGTNDSAPNQVSLPQSDLLTRFMRAEELAKQDTVLPVIENELAVAYQSWRASGCPADQVDSVAKQLELYLQLSTQTNKRLLLERFVVSSL